jgi:hypothetical protein
MVVQVKYALKITLSIFEVIQILGISAVNKTPVKELLTELQINQKVKDKIIYLVSIIY